MTTTLAQVHHMQPNSGKKGASSTLRIAKWSLFADSRRHWTINAPYLVWALCILFVRWFIHSHIHSLINWIVPFPWISISSGEIVAGNFPCRTRPLWPHNKLVLIVVWNRINSTYNCKTGNNLECNRCCRNSGRMHNDALRCDKGSTIWTYRYSLLSPWSTAKLHSEAVANAVSSA